MKFDCRNLSAWRQTYLTTDENGVPASVSLNDFLFCLDTECDIVQAGWSDLFRDVIVMTSADIQRETDTTWALLITPWGSYLHYLPGCLDGSWCDNFNSTVNAELDSYFSAQLYLVTRHANRTYSLVRLTDPNIPYNTISHQEIVEKYIRQICALHSEMNLPYNKVLFADIPPEQQNRYLRNLQRLRDRTAKLLDELLPDQKGDESDAEPRRNQDQNPV